MCTRATKNKKSGKYGERVAAKNEAKTEAKIASIFFQGTRCFQNSKPALFPKLGSRVASKIPKTGGKRCFQNLRQESACQNRGKKWVKN